MKKTAVLLVSGLLLVGSAAAFAESAPQAIRDLANSTLAGIGTDPVIVQAVKEQNSQGKTLEQIQEMDKKWQETPGIADYMQTMMDSACGRRLREIQNTAGYYAEIFVMDNKGANVAMTDKTSDYWQGDEDKFQKSFAGGAGAVFVDDVEFDDSAQAYLVQVSVPVRDNDEAIGAITFGIDVDKAVK